MSHVNVARVARKGALPSFERFGQATSQIFANDIAVNKAQLENDAMTQQQAIIEDVFTTVDSKTAADKYKKVFGPCCEVAQSGCGCNCNDTPAVVR